MGEDEVIAFIRQSLGSVYAIEVLLLVMRHTDRRWLAADLVRELRSSPTAVAEALGRLVQAGLVSESPEERFTFAPASERLAQTAGEIQKLYATAPISVMTAVVATPDRKRRS
jgi:DNA-binding IclR family transcriptional regulator